MPIAAAPALFYCAPSATETRPAALAALPTAVAPYAELARSPTETAPVPTCIRIHADRGRKVPPGIGIIAVCGAPQRRRRAAAPVATAPLPDEIAPLPTATLLVLLALALMP